MVDLGPLRQRRDPVDLEVPPRAISRMGDWAYGLSRLDVALAKMVLEEAEESAGREMGGALARDRRAESREGTTGVCGEGHLLPYTPFSLGTNAPNSCPTVVVGSPFTLRLQSRPKMRSGDDAGRRQVRAGGDGAQ